MSWDDDEYPGFEEYGVPTQDQIDRYLEKEREREAYDREHPVYGCRDESSYRFSLGDFDRCLRDIYAPGLRRALSESHPMLVVPSRRRTKRVWFKPWTWRRRWVPVSVADTLNVDKVPANFAVGQQVGNEIKIVRDPYCPPGKAYMINPRALHPEPATWDGFDPGDWPWP